MALWVDKYQPRSLSALDYHKEQAATLAELVMRDDFPHLLVYGPEGAGKKTRVHALLRELYGQGVEHMKMETKSFTAPSGRKLDLQTVSSNYHIEITPGDVGIFDRVVVQEIVKQMAQTAQIDVATQKIFKVVVLHEVDSLSRDAQHALRRTMEMYSGNCRLILVGQSLSRVIDPLRSRCMAIRVAAPKDEEIKSIVTDVYRKETKSAVPESVLKELLVKSKGNLRRALLALEAAHAERNPLVEHQKIPEPDWQIYLHETAELLLKRQNAETLLAVRNRVYELLSRCIPAPVIFIVFVYELLPHCTSATARSAVIEAAAEYEHRLTKGQKSIFHLEAFFAAFMHIYQNQHL